MTPQDGGHFIVPVFAADGHGELGIAPCQLAFPVADDGPGREHVVQGGQRVGAPGLQADTEVLGVAVCGSHLFRKRPYDRPGCDS